MASTEPVLPLYRLSIDLLEAIIALLPFLDICSLRLVSRTVAARSDRGAYKRYFRAKTVQWTSEQLQEFVQLTQPNWMGCFLQRLTIVGIVLPTGQDPTSTSDRLFSQALSNLRRNSPHGYLQSVVLLVQGRDDNDNLVLCEKIRDWRAVWLAAARTFQRTCHALSDSALPVHELDLFGSVVRCSLSCDQIAPVLDSIDLSEPLENVRRMSLSLSHPTERETPRPLAEGKRHAEDIGRLLDLCPQLESLSLHWYRLGGIKLIEAQTEERRFLGHIVQSKRLSQLRHCRLEGIYTDETALLAFLQKATELSRFIMEQVVLEGGKFEPVFNYLTSHMSNLEHLHLDDLWESRLIRFEGPGQPHFPSTGSRNGSNDLTRIGIIDCRRPIKYHLPSGESLGSVQLAHWRRRKALRYGPPE